MKHVKTMALPQCDKLIYSAGTIARQIGVMFVVDDEKPDCAQSFPIVGGGTELADGMVPMGGECYETEVVCRAGERISPRHFSRFVKLGMREEIPTTASELYRDLRENGSDLQLPVNMSDHEPIRKYSVELEFHDFKEESYCVSSDTSYFFFEVYFERGDHDEVYRVLMSQLMDYVNILDREDLGAQIVFTTLDMKYMDVVKRLNSEPIGTNYCDMEDPR